MYRIKDRVRIATTIVLYGMTFAYLVSIYGFNVLTFWSAILLVVFIVVGKILW